MMTEFVTTRCARLLCESTPIILGISPFNSYFSEQTIFNLAQWAESAGSNYYIYVPDGPTVYTLEAIGYERNKAMRKAGRQNRYLKNKIYRALSRLGQTEAEIADRLLNSERLDADPVYLSILTEVHELWKNNPLFRQGCLDTAHWVLLNQPCTHEIWDQSAVELAARYFLAELPLFLQSPAIIDHPSAIFCYHHCPDFLYALYKPDRFELLHEQQGFVICKPPRTVEESARRQAMST
ncbi:MAG: tRNA-dependent cyclodipeptide synthase [Xanthomonadales bacterium]|nr:tRNA-dependent cyclodipeptide synthase [Xanthomonadales bacterium]